MNDVELQALDDKELRKRYQDLWVSRMYYMAAEAETEARNECEKKFDAVVEEMNKRGLELT